MIRGVGMASVREARRAARRGDHERAKALASEVVEAWSVLDVNLPVVAEMRRLAK